MSRPERIEDCPQYRTDAREFVRVDPQFLTVDVKVGVALLQLIAAARESEHFEVDEDGQFVVKAPLSDADLDSVLVSEQRSWDTSSAWHSEASWNTRHVETWKRTSIDRWSQSEGLEPVDWDAHDAFFAARADGAQQA